MGSVYQRQSDGRWVAAVKVGSRKLVRYAETEKRAHQKLRELEVELGLSRVSLPAKLTLSDWIQDWLRAKELRPSSRARYESCLQAWDQEIGPTRLHRLSPSLIRAILLTWREQGVGKRSLEQRWTYLHGCLEEAVSLGILLTNPMDRVPKPRARHIPRALWEPEQALAFLDVALASSQANAPLLAFLLLTGLRLSEALALDPFELQEDQISITQALVWNSSSWSIQPPKTEAGDRTLELHPWATEILLRYGPFRTSTGTPPRPSNLSRLMTRLCAEAEVPRIQLRGLRRVHAALLIDGGLDPKALQAHLGHSRVQVSLDIYAYRARVRDQSAQALSSSLGLPMSIDPSISSK